VLVEWLKMEKLWLKKCKCGHKFEMPRKDETTLQRLWKKIKTEPITRCPVCEKKTTKTVKAVEKET